MKYSAIREGDILIANSLVQCLLVGQEYKVHRSTLGYYVICPDGLFFYIQGCIGKNGALVGFTLKE